MSVEFNKRQIMMNREQDGFLDFKIFTRLSILELKLIIYPRIPSVKVMSMQMQQENQISPVPQMRKAVSHYVPKNQRFQMHTPKMAKQSSFSMGRSVQDISYNRAGARSPETSMMII